MKTILQFRVITLIILTMVLSIGSSNAQDDYSKYLRSANEKFVEGDYGAAEKSLNTYERMSGATQSQLRTNITQCLTSLDNARKAEATQDYSQAKKCYEDIFRLNPLDPKAKSEMSRLDDLIRQEADKQNALKYQAHNKTKKQSSRKNLLTKESWDKGNYVMWNVLKVEIPWAIETGVSCRFGGIIGFGGYFNTGMSFPTVRREYPDSYRGESHVQSGIVVLKYDVGIMLYPYKNLFISCGYGCTGKDAVLQVDGSIYDDDEREWKTSYYSEFSREIIVTRIGYNINMKGFSLTPNIGISHDLEDKSNFISIGVSMNARWHK